MKLTDEEARFLSNVAEGCREGNFGVHRSHIERMRAIINRLSAQAPMRLLTEGQDEVGEIEKRHAHDQSYCDKGAFGGATQGLQAHRDRATLLRILNSQVPQAPVVADVEALAKWFYEHDNATSETIKWETRNSFLQGAYRKCARDLLSSGLLHPAPTREEIYNTIYKAIGGVRVRNHDHTIWIEPMRSTDISGVSGVVAGAILDLISGRVK